MIFALVAAGLGRRVRRLEAEVARLRAAPVDTAETRTIEDVPAPPPIVAAPEPPAPIEPEFRGSPAPARGIALESLVGGKLPVWIGGAALVFAGFFLVRYSVESGLIGPGVRVVLAALFSAALVAASEGARASRWTRDDPRIAQVLAGAGIASAYGTLYIAAALYALIGAAPAFVAMVALTAAALALALRHGPPTAIMALVGGFAAPLVAGYDAAGLGALFAYLALLIAALFALAARRGWRWLAITAIVAGFGWANLLLALVDPGGAGAIAAFTVALAIGATLALPKTGETRGWLTVAPLIAGLLQLLVLAPALDFTALAWSFHLVLAAAALALAWRRPDLLAGAVAAAAVVAVLVAAGMATAGPATPWAAAIATTLFGTIGGVASRRDPRWVAVALIGIAGPVLGSHVAASWRLDDFGWAAAELVLAAAAAAIAWRHRDRTGTRDAGLVGASAIAALLAGVGAATVAGAAWQAVALVPIAIALGLWARRVAGDDWLATLAAIGIVAVAFAGGHVLIALVRAAGLATAGERLSFPLLPTLADTARGIAPAPLAAAAILALDRAAFGRRRAIVAGAALALAVAAGFVLAKQPLAIATPGRFVTLGLGERGAITLLLLALGWALVRRSRLAAAGHAIAAFAVARFVWFDLILLNPVAIPQQVGAWPVANAAVLLPAAIALGAATIAPIRSWRRIALAATIVAVLAGVRQIAHGSLLTGPVGNGESWGYSAALLLLSLAWLWRGIVGDVRGLRIAGLALITLVTLKVFLIDVAMLGGVLRILAFLGLGIALIGIGWAYGRIVGRAPAPEPPPSR